MNYLILINANLWRPASCLEHAALALKDLKPEHPAEVLSKDGREWYRWNPQRLELEQQSDAYLLRSKSEQGYWNNAQGWVSAVDLASRFTLEEIRQINLPMARDRDVELVRVDDSLTDFAVS